MKSDAKIDRLAAVPMLAGCDRTALATIAGIADELLFEAGRDVFTQGAHLRHAYIVVDGAATVTIDGNHVGEIGPGEVIGEVTMFDPAPALATVTATVPTSMLAIEHGHFIDTVRHNPDLGIAVLKSMAHHVHLTQTMYSSPASKVD